MIIMFISCSYHVHIMFMHGLSLLDLRRHAQGPGKAGARGRDFQRSSLDVATGVPLAVCSMRFGRTLVHSVCAV